MSSTATSGAAVVSPAERVEVLFEELAELAGQRNAIDGRIVEIVAELDRDGKDHVIWVVELDEPAAGVKITWTPIEPTLPSIDFGDLGEDSGASGER